MASLNLNFSSAHKISHYSVVTKGDRPRYIVSFGAGPVRRGYKSKRYMVPVPVGIIGALENDSTHIRYGMVWYGLLFHMTQPTSRSIIMIKDIACSKLTISEH